MLPPKKTPFRDTRGEESNSRIWWGRNSTRDVSRQEPTVALKPRKPGPGGEGAVGGEGLGRRGENA